MVRPRETAVKLPSDLAGMTAALYDWPRDDKDVVAAVGAACDDVREAIRSLGVLETRVAPQIQAVKAVQEQQQQKIDALTFGVSHFLPKFEFEHLESLACGAPFRYDMHPGFEQEIRNLWALHFIEKRDLDKKIADMPRSGDLQQFFYVTEEGATYLRLRKEAQERRS